MVGMGSPGREHRAHGLVGVSEGWGGGRQGLEQRPAGTNGRVAQPSAQSWSGMPPEGLLKHTAPPPPGSKSAGLGGPENVHF